MTPAGGSRRDRDRTTAASRPALLLVRRRLRERAVAGVLALADLLLRAAVRRGLRDAHPGAVGALAARRARNRAHDRSAHGIARRPRRRLRHRPHQLALGAADPLHPLRDAVVGGALRAAVRAADERRQRLQPRLDLRRDPAALAGEQLLRRRRSRRCCRTWRRITTIASPSPRCRWCSAWAGRWSGSR